MNKPIVRIIIIALFTVFVMVMFIFELMNIQIVNADSYKKAVGDNRTLTQVIKGTRGEIIDKNGEPLAVNRMGYDVIIDRATFPTASRNEIILELITLFEELGETYTDNLPVTMKAPFRYLDGRDADITRARKFLNLSDYATAEDMMYWFDDWYGTDAVDENENKLFTPEQARKIIGVRYEMAQRGFSDSAPYTFATDIAMSSVLQIKERSFKLAGVDVIENTVRVIPDGLVAPHLIGRIGPIYPEDLVELDLEEKGYSLDDTLGKSGAESAFEDILRGTNGVREIHRDASGALIDTVESESPVPGNTVRMTIDSNLQRVTAEAFRRNIERLNNETQPGKGQEADNGAAVVVEVKTGKVLAAVSYPAYDLTRYYEDYSLFLADENYPLINRALMGAYAPGSTFKPVVATLGLGTGLVDAHSTVLCTSVYMLPGSPQRFTCLDAHGAINVLNALRVSCNTYFYNTGYRGGIDLVDETARLFGLGEKTGIELAERKGQRSNPEAKMIAEETEWYPGDTLQSSIGQLYNSLTPIQLANYAATIANRGTRMKLTMVDEILDYSQQTVVKPFEPVVAETLPYPREVFETIVDGMILASGPTGTAIYFNNYPITVASKTGTPETADLCNSIFITFAPAEDPEIAIAVVTENGWHGFTSAPVAKEIYDEYFGFNKPQPTETESEAESAADEASAVDIADEGLAEGAE